MTHSLSGLKDDVCLGAFGKAPLWSSKATGLTRHTRCRRETAASATTFDLCSRPTRAPGYSAWRLPFHRTTLRIHSREGHLRQVLRLARRKDIACSMACWRWACCSVFRGGPTHAEMAKHKHLTPRLLG